MFGSGAASIAKPPRCIVTTKHTLAPLMSRMSQSQGHRFLLTCVDRFTRWCEAIPLVDRHIETVKLALLQNWISRFGAPKADTTDCGPQFKSTLFAKLCEFLGCERIRATPYHPAANGMVVRLHRQLKAALMSHAAREHWVDNWPIVLLGNR